MSVTAKKKSGWWESVNDGLESSGEVREGEREREREKERERKREREKERVVV